MTFTPGTVAEIAEVLDRAELDGVQISKLTTWFPRMDLDDAYAVQRAVRWRKQTRGYRVAGFRLASLREIAVGDLAYGVLYESSLCPNGAGINWLELLQPRIEPALTIITNVPLRGAECTVEDVLGAIDSVMPAFDVMDCRYRGWNADSCSVIADNCSIGRVVLGQMRCPIGRFDPRAELLVTRNGKTFGRTTIGATLRDLASSIVALTQFLDHFGDEVPAGSVVLRGGITEPVSAVEHDRFTAVFHGLGPVEMRFVSFARQPASRATVTVRER